jgi:hypothetical protein
MVSVRWPGQRAGSECRLDSLLHDVEVDPDGG